MKGSFLKRYNRFLVDIMTNSGNTITAYCPATGRLKTCVKKEATVEYLPVANDNRKLNYDWWSIKLPESWIIIDTRPANQWLYWHRTAPWLPESWAGADWYSEPSLPGDGRLDYRLDFRSDTDTWIEIKSVTWCEDGIGYFPDAPTKRGQRHLQELIQLSENGNDAYLIFVSMRSDINVISSASDIDPDFSKKLKLAKQKGVELIGIESDVDDRSLHLTGRIPVQL